MTKNLPVISDATVREFMGNDPCGECHLRYGEVCNICGRSHPFERPKDSNADEWHLFLAEHKDALPFLAVQIAEAIDQQAKALVAEIDRLRTILKAADHTLTVHGKIDCDTPLHQRIAAGAAVA